jgi:hypothetical protein
MLLAAHVKDYRPISLIHSFVKLVAKLLANGLTPHLPNLVSINQSAFVKGRSIQDNFLLCSSRPGLYIAGKNPIFF